MLADKKARDIADKKETAKLESQKKKESKEAEKKAKDDAHKQAIEELAAKKAKDEADKHANGLAEKRAKEEAEQKAKDLAEQDATAKAENSSNGSGKKRGRPPKSMTSSSADTDTVESVEEKEISSPFRGKSTLLDSLLHTMQSFSSDMSIVKAQMEVLSKTKQQALVPVNPGQVLDLYNFIYFLLVNILLIVF